MAADVFSYLLFEPLDPKELNLLKDLTTSEICQVWWATSKYIREELLEKRVSLTSCSEPSLPFAPEQRAGHTTPCPGPAGHPAPFPPLPSAAMSPSSCLTFQAVDIGIGSFAVVPAHATAGEDGVLDVDRPVFQLNHHIQKFYKLKEPKTKIPPEIFEYPLDFQEIAESIYFRVPIVQQCIHETLLFFAEALRGKKEVDFFFNRLGILSLRGQEVIMNFFDDCVLQVDATGNMLPALLGDSEMLNMIAFRGKNNFTRCSEDGCFVLPR
ncbi:coiled-coil domain-containing protein 81-like isoform X1 [Phasianus colchicus]|uniref:coiled-coil domain-containing protein 81-like isoform X1 n=1 Tax=Phasianus colchicus TaxID=9054 RepID=UPI00129DBE75|nr:coiled-coil domain-containing protein 81-like isoform X1 [Phasianus colchicus]